MQREIKRGAHIPSWGEIDGGIDGVLNRYVAGS
jgi:hypothetical protein